MQFATGASRLPAGGFGALRPPFQITIDGGRSAAHLPEAHTCFNEVRIGSVEI
jgi:hypothetical protein